MLLAQLVAVFGALLQVTVLARALAVQQFGLLNSLTAIWSIAVAAAGTAVGSRLMRDASAQGTSSISLSAREVAGMGGVVVLAALAGASIGLPVLTNGLQCFALVALLLAEIRSSHDLGCGRRGRYASRLIGRALLVPLGLAAWSVFSDLSLNVVVLLVLCVNAAVAAVPVRGWALRPTAPIRPMWSVGGANLGLWVLASGDRVVLALRSSLEEVAIYGLVYGLLDRAFRAVSSAYVAASLPRAFLVDGKETDPRATVFRGGVTALAVLAGPMTVIAVPLISDGTYAADTTLVLLIVGALLLNAWAVPLYVRAHAMGRMRLLVVVSLFLAAANLLANWLLAPTYGAMGAAGASAASYALWLVAVFVVVRTRRP